MGGEQKQKQKQQQQQKQGRNAGGKKGGAEGGRDAQQKAEMEPPQAIVIADPFCNRFEAVAPTPSVMLPLASSATPLIDNTLEMLRRAGISDIVVACGKDTLEPVAAHVEELQRGRHEHIKMVNCPKAFSVGDLLREVFSRQLISSKTFGDVVSNMDLTKAINAHIENVSKDKSCIMTVVFSKTGVHAANRSLEDQTVLGLRPDTNEILLYQWQASSKSLHVPKELMYHKKRAVKSVSVRADLCDPGIIVCSPAVLAQMQDDFDFRSVTPDLMKGLLDHCDTLGYKAYAYVEEEHYAACVRDLRTYMAVTRDYLGRWAYPLVPDANTTDTTSFALARSAVYKEKGVVCEKNAQLGRCVAVGAGTRIASDARVAHSVVGRACTLARRCTVDGCIVWDNVTVGEEAVVTDALLCTGAVVGKNAIIGRGAVIGTGVRIGSFVTIPPFSQIVLPRYAAAAAASDLSDDDGDGDGYGYGDDDVSVASHSGLAAAGDGAGALSPPPIVRLQDPADAEGLVGTDGEGVVLRPAGAQHVFNTLVPRDPRAEDALFLGQDARRAGSDDDDGDGDGDGDGYASARVYGHTLASSEAPAPNRALSRSSRSTSPGDEGHGSSTKFSSFLDDDDDDDSEGDEDSGRAKSFLDDDNDDDDNDDGSDDGDKKQPKTSFLDDDDDDDSDAHTSPKKGFLDSDDDDDEDEDHNSDDDDDEKKPQKRSFLDSDGENDDDEDLGLVKPNAVKAVPSGEKKKSFLDSDDEDEDTKPATTSSSTSTAGTADFFTDSKFQGEISDLVTSVFNKTCPLVEFHLQVRVLRMTYNTTDTACGCAIVRKLLKVAANPPGQTVMELVTSINKVIKRWGTDLVAAHVKENHLLLESLLEVCSERHNPFNETLFPQILHILYSEGLLYEQTLLDWEAEMKNSPATRYASFFAASAPFFVWLHAE